MVAGATILVGAGGLPSATAASANSASAPGITPTSVLVAQIASLTGSNASSADGTDAIVGAKARIALQNAHGGVYGRKIHLISLDDQTNPATATTAVQSAIETQGAFALLSTSGLLFAAAPFLQQNGIPVIGDGDDGQEWCEQPYTNMFEITGECDARLPQYTTMAAFMKAHGVTDVASLGYGISPSSAASARGFALAAQYEGLKVGYLDDNVPFGSVDVTAYALAMKSAGVNGLYMSMAANTSVAMVTAAKQGGVNLKVAVLPDGYGQGILSDPAAVQAVQGSYFTSGREPPSELDFPALQAQKAAMKKYAGVTGVIGTGYTNGWLSADLFIKGLELAGRNPTRQSYIAALRKVSHYTAGGLLAVASNLTLAQFGHAPATNCAYLVRMEGRKFVPVPSSGRPICGHLIPNSDQMPANP
jgi:branched-chain amino acid transport system substrate-binding protein